MVRILCILAGVAAAAAVEDVPDDLTSMLQTHISQHNQNQACTPVKVGDVAPVNGLFNGQQVQIGEVAQKSGTFCVDKEVLALIQRSFGMSSLKDIEVAVSKKGSSTTFGEVVLDSSIHPKDRAKVQEELRRASFYYAHNSRR